MIEEGEPTAVLEAETYDSMPVHSEDVVVKIVP